MGVKKTFADTIRIVVVIHMFMMAAMFAGPEHNRILKCSSSENNRQ